MEKILMTAVRAAIAEIGVNGLKRTSLFMSNERAAKDQRAAA